MTAVKREPPQTADDVVNTEPETKKIKVEEPREIDTLKKEPTTEATVPKKEDPEQIPEVIQFEDNEAPTCQDLSKTRPPTDEFVLKTIKTTSAVPIMERITEEFDTFEELPELKHKYNYMMIKNAKLDVPAFIKLLQGMRRDGGFYGCTGCHVDVESLDYPDGHDENCEFYESIESAVGRDDSDFDSEDEDDEAYGYDDYERYRIHQNIMENDSHYHDRHDYMELGFIKTIEAPIIYSNDGEEKPVNIKFMAEVANALLGFDELEIEQRDLSSLLSGGYNDSAKMRKLQYLQWLEKRLQKCKFELWLDPADDMKALQLGIERTTSYSEEHGVSYL